VHPRYNRSTSANDVAVIRLRDPVTTIEPLPMITSLSNLDKPGAKVEKKKSSLV
jgi:hypothetical protein